MKLRLNTLLVLLAASLLLGGALRPSEASPQGVYPEVGYQAPPFTLTDGAGEIVSLSNYQGQALLLNFWASWCPPCKAEAPEIHRLNQDLPKGSALLTINWTATETSPDAAARWLAEQQLVFPLALDPKGEVTGRYQVHSLPTSFIISPEGQITAKVTGPMSEATMRHYLSAAQQQPAAAPANPAPFWALTFQQAALVGLAGLAVAYYWTKRRAPAFGLSPGQADDLFFSLLLGAFLGSRLLYALREPAVYLLKPWNLIILARGDLVLPGALLGLGLALLWVSRKATGRQAVGPFLAASLAPFALSVAPYLASQIAFGGFIAAGAATGVGLLLLVSRAPWPSHLALGTLAISCALTTTLYFLPGNPLAGGVTWVQLAFAGLGVAAWVLGRRQIEKELKP